MKILSALVLTLFISIEVHCQDEPIAAASVISGDVGVEPPQSVPQATLPTIDWSKLVQNIPTLPPFVFPTFPTLPPLPTLDPNFWNNLPTLSPLVLPTLDPNFWKNLPSLPPLPTLDPNFWQNLPTLPPLPTLDPNFWNNLPTLAPLTFPTLPPFVFPTPTPKTSQCTYKLADKMRKDANFSASLDFMSPQNLVTSLMNEATTLCTPDQAVRLSNLNQKYSILISDTTKIIPLFNLDELKLLTLAILNGDSSTVSQLFFTKTLNNLGNADVTKVSFQLSMLQFDLLMNPI